MIALVDNKETINKDYRICVMCHNKEIMMVESLKELKKELINLKS